MLAGLLIVVALAGLLALQYVARRPAVSAPEIAQKSVTYMAGSGVLERTLRLTAVADWGVERMVYAPVGGVVTEISAPFGQLSSGSVLLRLNERPMVVIPGVIPAFRAMSVGTRGRDVGALQDYLTGLDYRVATDRNSFTRTTAAAVRAWQTAIGLTPTGSVELGDVLIVEADAIGRPFRFSETVYVGSPVSPGTVLIELLADSPSLAIPFGGTPPAQLKEGLEGSATFPGGEKRPVIISGFESAQDRQLATLASQDGQLCPPAVCLSLVPALGSHPVTVAFTLVPRTTGPLVPAGAIQTDSIDGSFVVLADGTRRPVRLVVADGGLAIVDGITVGEIIALP